MGGGAAHLEAPGLILAAKQLKNDRLVRIFESFLENRACVGRAIIQGIAMVWSGVWTYGPQPVLHREALSVFPVTVALFAVSLCWMLLVRRRIVPGRDWLDAAGFAMNLMFIGVQTYYSFILLIWLNAFLPFIAIAAVARYGRRALRPALIGIFALLLLSAPPGYWLSRPAYFVYAVALTVVLPFMVARMVLAMQEIAFQALASRDAQSRFISTMSHELRTPLNAIINCAQLIDARSLEPGHQNLMKIVGANASALRHRVNEVLDVASIDGGRLRLVEKPTSLLDVVNTVLAVCANTASSKGVTLEVRMESAEAACILGDEGRIEQVITNLVTNAIKFTPPGGMVELAVSASRIEDRWSVVVSVVDTGIGIPDSEKEAIFAPFQQLSSGSSRLEGGVGLGLYIARSVCEAMGSSLSVNDNPVGGSIFRWQFAAPAVAADESRSMNLHDALREHRETVPRQKCLVFEDMEMNRIVIESLLSRAGHEVVFHADGADALQRIRQAEPNIVFLDLHMPGMSGWDALQQVSDSAHCLPAIIVLTADTRGESIRKAMAKGIAGYLAKPINANELLAAIRQHAARPQNGAKIEAWQ